MDSSGGIFVVFCYAFSSVFETLAHKRRTKFNSGIKIKSTQPRKAPETACKFLELLTRFELVTSSLPKCRNVFLILLKSAENNAIPVCFQFSLIGFCRALWRTILSLAHKWRTQKRTYINDLCRACAQLVSISGKRLSDRKVQKPNRQI